MVNFHVTNIEWCLTGNHEITYSTYCTFSCSLNVEPPSFTSKPDSQEVLPGSTVRLKATFLGTPPFTIQWFKEEEELSTGGTCYITKEALGTTLEIYAVKPSNSGNYVCKVSNVAGAISCSANLFVKGLQTLFLFDFLEPSCKALHFLHGSPLSLP